MQKGKELCFKQSIAFFLQILGFLVVSWRTRTAGYCVLILSPQFFIIVSAVWQSSRCFDKQA